jgi:hypothetical protein
MIASSGGPSAAATKIATVGASTGAGAYAESNATNAAVNELAYYAYSRGFATAGDNLDPAIPWSKNVKKGHVAVHIGCTSKPGGPKTFAASSSCDHGKPQALVLQSEASDGSVCYSIIADESGLQTVWYNADSSCPTSWPSAPPKRGSATGRKGWYSSF